MMHTDFPPLTILEEFLLLALDDASAEFYSLPRSMLDAATAGAILMDLTLNSRIDTDLHDIFILDTTPIGDDILDPLLQVMSLSPVVTPQPITAWLRLFMDEGEALRARALRRLEGRGIIRCEHKKIMWLFNVRHYPIIDDRPDREVKSRIIDIIVRDALPSPRDIMLVCLAESCGLSCNILPDRGNAKYASRIATISRMDMISQAVARSIAEIDAAIAMASGFH